MEPLTSRPDPGSRARPTPRRRVQPAAAVRCTAPLQRMLVIAQVKADVARLMAQEAVCGCCHAVISPLCGPFCPQCDADRVPFDQEKERTR